MNETEINNNNYEEKQNTLNKYIKQLSHRAYHIEIKNQIKKIIKDYDCNCSGSGDGSSGNEELNGLIKWIKSGYKLLSRDEDTLNDFINSNELVDGSHKLFNSIYDNIDSVTGIISKIIFILIGQEKEEIKIKLNQILNDYLHSHELFIEKIVNLRNTNQLKKPSDIYTPLPNLYGEDLECREIESIKLAYDMVSYDINQHKWGKQKGNGSSYVSIINDKMYLKVDNGNYLLRPAKEYAIYQFYKQLFNNLNSFALISPTQLIIVNQLKIIEIDNDVMKKLNRLKERYNNELLSEVLLKKPSFQTKLNGALKSSSPIPIQASLLVKGETLLEYLKKDGSNQINSKFELINFQSFSSHVIASLLLIPTDYKSDNLILEENTGNIIGIDNDESLSAHELVRKSTDVYIRVKNILYLIKPLMIKPLDQQIKNQIIQYNPNLFILKWLLNNYSKQSNYESLLSFSDINIKSVLRLPLKFNRGWITLMLSRFKTIIKLLNDNGNISHLELFKQIHPFASIYYESISSVTEIILDQMSIFYIGLRTFKELMNSHPPASLNKEEIEKLLQDIETMEIPIPNGDLIGFENPNEHSIKDTILELVLNSSYSDLCSFDNSVLVEFINLLLSNVNQDIIDSSDGGDIIVFHKSWKEFKYSILLDLLNSGSSIKVIDRFIKITNIQQTDIDVGLSIIHSLVNSNNSNASDQIDYLVKQFNIDIEKIENNKTIFTIK